MYELHREHRPPVIMRINGLDRDSQLQIGRNVCCNDESAFQDIYGHLQLHSSLFLLLHIPVYCHLVWAILKDSLCSDVPGEVKIETVTLLFLMTKRKYFRSNHVRDLDKKQRKEIISNLAKLAYKGIKESKIIFKHRDFEECGIQLESGDR